MSTRCTTEQQNLNPVKGTTSPRNMGELWDEALRRHEQETGTELLKIAIGKGFPLHPASADEVLAILAAQSRSFEAFRARGQNVLRVLKPTVHFICLFIDAGAEAGSGTIPGGKAILVAIGVLLQATKGVSGLYDVIEHLFKEIASYLNRVPIYLNSSTQPAPVLMDILVKTCVQVLEVLAMTTKYFNSSTKSIWGAVARRTKDYLREVMGGNEVKTALEKLEHLTNAELLAAVAQINVIARDVQPEMHFVANKAVLRGLREWLRPPDAPPLNWEKKRYNDSCVWFFDSKFESWMSQRNGVYWIYGNAGAGKSVLCSSIIDTLKKNPALSLAYFYFDFSDTTKQDCRALAASLVFQLATCSEACQSYLERQKTIIPPSYNELLVMLSGLVKLAGHVYIVIDALDECPEKERDRGSARFLKHLCELDSNEKDFHLLVTSRPEADIWDLLSSVTHILDLNVDKQHLEDVSAYITSRIDRNEYHWSSDVEKKVSKVLNEKSNGMFLWVDLQLLRLRDCITITDVENTLNELPPDLHNTYTHILEKSDPSKASVERRRRVFQCIASAKRPLSPVEVVEIYCADLDSRTPPIPIEDCEKFILKKCPGILSIVDWEEEQIVFTSGRIIHRSVQFIHFSAKEYLMSFELKGTSTLAHHYVFEDYSANLILARICLRAFDVDAILSNLRPYAGKYWTEHVSSHNEDDLSDLLDNFLRIGSSSFARWIRRNRTYSSDAAFSFAVELNLCHHVEKMLAQSSGSPSDAPGTKFLLKIPGRHGRPALHEAVYKGHIGMCHLLLSHGALVNDTDDDGDTPLHKAANRGYLDVVRVLLGHPVADGADPMARCRARNKRGQTPLHLAAGRHFADLCHLLLSHGALVYDADEDGDTPLHIAVRKGYMDVVRVLLEYPVANGGVPIARCRTRDKHGQTPLHLAAEQGRIDICRLLLSHDGALVDDADEDGNTPLHIAAREDYMDVVRVLFEHPVADGADPLARCRTRNKRGQTPLHLAAEQGRIDICRLLFSHGALVDDADEDGNTPLHIAARKGCMDVVRMLLEHPVADGADALARCRTRNKRGQTPLHLAAYQGMTGVCCLLLSQGALVDDTDEHGSSPLHDAVASRYGNSDVISTLLEHRVADGPDPAARCRARDKDGKTPLHSAAQHGRTDICRLLLSHGAVVDDADKDGDTPVHTAAQARYLWSNSALNTVRILLEHRAKDAPHVLPSARKLRKDIRRYAEWRPGEPWHAILEDFAAQLGLVAELD